ncbi:MAG: (2Fe-2S)-binding protein [Oscillospiraceae bacterium]|nr:(2Fe-2S)-binding protein [Oscillospiraceae bacterium]
MATNRIICEKNNVEYLTIRKAMCADARTKEEIKAMAGVCLECEGCRRELDGILASVCGCKGVSLAAVVEAVKGGADTVEKVGEVTGAGTDCGRCKILIENVIKLGS